MVLENVWTIEKWFVLQHSLKHHNDSYSDPVNPQEIYQCKKTHESKVTTWVGIIDSHALPVVWFCGSVNEEVYRTMS